MAIESVAPAIQNDDENRNLGPESFLRLLDSRLKGNDRRLLFSAVAERVRTGLLTHDEASLLAGWFEDLASGKDAKRALLGELRGRKKGSNSTQLLKGRDISLPDHVDLCWSLRRWIAQTGDEDKVFDTVAKHFGRTRDYLQGLYKEIAPTLAADPELPPTDGK